MRRFVTDDLPERCRQHLRRHLRAPLNRCPPANRRATKPQAKFGATLSTPFHKYNHVCDEGFLAQTRRERRAYPSGVCKERVTTSGPKSTLARRVASLFGSGFVAPRSQPPLRGMLPRRASPEPKIDATNVVVFMKRGTKPCDVSSKELPRLPRSVGRPVCRLPP